MWTLCENGVFSLVIVSQRRNACISDQSIDFLKKKKIKRLT